ncbi:MAG: radical SAM protein [Coriobacteriales bacterium]|nr:radical SAM protein [Coriobacteriales bacterium]
MISYATANTTDWRQMSPREVVDRALKLKRRGCIGIAYTYNEPFINLEFMRDCGELAHENGLVNVVVSNGMVSWSALESVAHLIDAANIDLKGFSRKFYDDICGSYECVMSTIETLATLQSCHLEVTTLVIPGLNDSPEGIDAAAQWLAGLSDEIPYHVTRFFPSFKYGNRQPTPIETVYVLAEVARKHLRYVFTGNC